MTLDPGHFHAALIHKDMYSNVDSTIEVFASPGPELDDYLARIDGYNSREENPTSWNIEWHESADPLSQMVSMSPGNVMVVAGKNDRKIDYILEAVKAGFHVYADKPLVLNPAGFEKLEEALRIADEKGLLLYDIMTERFEITSILQKELTKYPEIFGEQVAGSAEDPGISKESVHHFSKTVSGKPLVRPGWFFDSSVEGDGLVDVTTHLVDLIQWTLESESVINRTDIEMIDARLWPTVLSPDEFNQVTGLDTLKTNLAVDCNGEMLYTLGGVYAKVKVAWDFKAPQGGGDTHFSKIHGSKANLIIRQGTEENYVPQLYVELLEDQVDDLREVVENSLQTNFTGLSMIQMEGNTYQIKIPEIYRKGHEAHFAQVTEKFLEYFEAGDLPNWEKSFLDVKYFTTTEASRMARVK
ncbi:putative oxidoreductase C-terminal domain-containing protein [Algoriphagus sp. C2-7]|uniref:Oxidoreductase C-terminal domain-containing protein n=2 Tax=Algoriphagus sediminis TaxID=3057113 RepID=A0ABT7YAP2_9BACT|nr:putative oxidoreductase C-terminal domain-containing protein [Algoriphagus sediminis]